MRFVVRSSIVLVMFWFNAAAAQEGYLGHDQAPQFLPNAPAPRYQDPVL
jgi:hypothetical protein